MGISEVFRSALTSLWSHKVRTLLTLLGMIVGVFAIITSVTAVKVIDVYFQERLNFLGSSTFNISRYPEFEAHGDDRRRERKAITYAQVEELERRLNSAAVLSVIEDFDLGAVRFASRETEPNVILLGSDAHFLENFSYEVAQGRSLSEQDVQYGRPVTVLGDAVADELFPNESPLGKVVEIKGLRLQVIGVLEAKGNFLGFNIDNRMFVPISYLFSRYGHPERNIAAISVRAPSVELVPAAMEDVIGKLRTIRKVRPGEDNDFEIETNDSMRSIFEAFTGVLTMGGAGIGLIALLAAGIGIMNIMLVSVTERTREIGIRKSIGARRTDIMRQFLLEAFFLCQIGGFFGILLGILLGNGVAIYFDISAAIPWGWAIAAVVMVSIISLVFGGYPAYKAARLDPIDALRYE